MITVYSGENRSPGPSHVFGPADPVRIENNTPDTEQVRLTLESCAFERILYKPSPHGHQPIDPAVPFDITVPPGITTLFPYITPGEVAARYRQWAADGFTVAMEAGLTAVRCGNGPVTVLVVTRLQPQETSGIFLVDGMLSRIKAKGLPEAYTFVFVIDPDPERVKTGPSVPEPRFSPQGPSTAERNLKTLVDRLKPSLYINLHDWTGKAVDGFYAVDDALWIPRFLERAAADPLYNKEWSCAQKQNVPRVTPYPKDYSIGEEMARYCFIEHSAMAVYAEFPWDGRSAEDMQTIGGHFLADITGVFEEFKGPIKALSKAYRGWHGGKGEKAVKALIKSAEEVCKGTESRQAAEHGLRAAGFLDAKHKAFRAFKAHRQFPTVQGPRAPVSRVGVYQPSDGIGHVSGAPLLAAWIKELGYEPVSLADLHAERLDSIDALVLPPVEYMGTADGPGLYEALTGFCAGQGKGILMFHDTCGQEHSLCGYSLFPAVCGGARFYDSYRDENRTVTAAPNGLLGLAGVYRQSFQWKKHLAPGPDGTVEAVDNEDLPLVITGSPGKGRLVLSGLLVGDALGKDESFPDGDGGLEKEILVKALEWFRRG